jgi:hypothetical protein
MLTSVNGIAEDADIPAFVFWPDIIVIKCPTQEKWSALSVPAGPQGCRYFCYFAKALPYSPFG